MRIEVFADIACPWCYIGVRRLNRALAARPAVTAEKIWRPFQLQPGMPAEGVPYKAYLAQKFGGESRLRQAWDAVAKQGEPEEIAFNFDRVATAFNSANGHRLVLWAAEQGRAFEMAEALFKAHFTDGADLASAEGLLAAAAVAGFDTAAAQSLLASDRFAAEVTASQETAAALGIQGVPFYVIDGKYGLSGAQPYEVFLQMLDQLAAPPP